MQKITKARRQAVKQVLAASSKYDPQTLRIYRDGYVSAKRDANKTFNGPEVARHYIGHIDEIVTATGEIREGW